MRTLIENIRSMEKLFLYPRNHLLRFAISTEHKGIRTKYIGFAAIVLILGSIFSFMIRWELAHTGDGLFMGDYHHYNVVITSYALIMIFFVVMSKVIVRFILIMVGAPEMARLGNFQWSLSRSIKNVGGSKLFSKESKRSYSTISEKSTIDEKKYSQKEVDALLKAQAQAQKDKENRFSLFWLFQLPAGIIGIICYGYHNGTMSLGWREFPIESIHLTLLIWGGVILSLIIPLSKYFWVFVTFLTTSVNVGTTLLLKLANYKLVYEGYGIKLERIQWTVQDLHKHFDEYCRKAGVDGKKIDFEKRDEIIQKCMDPEKIVHHLMAEKAQALKEAISNFHWITDYAMYGLSLGERVNPMVTIQVVGIVLAICVHGGFLYWLLKSNPNVESVNLGMNTDLLANAAAVSAANAVASANAAAVSAATAVESANAAAVSAANAAASAATAVIDTDQVVQHLTERVKDLTERVADNEGWIQKLKESMVILKDLLSSDVLPKL